MQTIGTKDPAEVITVTFDFAPGMAISETISTAVVSCTVRAGTDPAAASMPQGSASIVGQTVLQRIGLGVSETSYALECSVTTSAGQTLIIPAALLVRDLSTT